MEILIYMLFLHTSAAVTPPKIFLKSRPLVIRKKAVQK